MQKKWNKLWPDEPLGSYGGLDVWVIDQVWGQNGWILARFFSCVFMDFDFISVHKLAKKKRGQYPAILTEQTWSIKDLLYGFWGNFACGIQRVVRSGSQSQRVIWFISPTHGASHIIKLDIAKVLFLACLWTRTESISINSQKKNETYIQPSSPNELDQ